MENEEHKKGRDKMKDKKEQIIFMQNSISCHIYKVERVHRMGLLFVLHGNRTNCHQQQYESCGFEPNLLIIQVFRGKYVIRSPL